MTLAIAHNFGASAPPRFSALTKIRPLTPIHNDKQLDEALQIMDTLGIHDRLSAGQKNYLESLRILVQAYERKRMSQEAKGLDAIGVLRHLLEEHDMTASDLGRLLGSRPLGWAILNSKRSLSKAHIKTLSGHFAVGAGLFID